jgi:hypothetical protein
MGALLIATWRLRQRRYHRRSNRQTVIATAASHAFAPIDKRALKTHVFKLALVISVVYLCLVSGVQISACLRLYLDRSGMNNSTPQFISTLRDSEIYLGSFQSLFLGGLMTLIFRGQGDSKGALDTEPKEKLKVDPQRFH